MTFDEEAMESERLVERTIAEEAEIRARRPKLIYKYKSLDSISDVTRICEILKELKIYMPNLEELNDPLEGLNARLVGESPLKREAMRREYRILSFSASGFLPQMWAHYANNYNGLCLAFRTDETFSDIKEVKYADKHKSFTSDLELSLEDDMLIKGEDWEPEEEWRYLKKEHDFCIDADGTRKFFEHFRKRDLACVIIGYKVPIVIRNIIEQSIPNGVGYFQIVPDDKAFRLGVVNLADRMKLFSTNELLKACESGK